MQAAILTTRQDFMPSKQADSFIKLLLLWAIVIMGFIQLSNPAYADGGNLTDIFTTKSFQGSWEVINKFNWVGMIMNFIISAFCLIGLCMVFYQRLISLLYLSSRGVFDNVYDMKNTAKGSGFFGFSGMGRDIVQGNRGTGLDAIVGLIYAFLPNVKAYSDYNPEKMAYNLQEDDNVVTYMLKTALPTVMLVFFFAIGFSGTLAKAYGTIVNAMSTAADKAVTVNLDGYVTRLMNTGESYKFTIGSNGTAEGKMAEKIARDVYGKVLSRLDLLDTPTRLLVGKRVEEWAWGTVLNNGYGQTAYDRLSDIVANNTLDDGSGIKSVRSEMDVNALSYELVVNTSDTLGTTAKGNIEVDKKLVDFVSSIATPSNTGNNNSANLSIAEQLSLHLIVRKDKTPTANFFIRPNTQQP